MLAEVVTVTSWLLGVVIGAFAGGLELAAGTLVVLLPVPALVWAARERSRPLGSGGLLVGVGVSVGGLIAWADARCRADPSCYIPDDHTPWFVFAAVLVAAGAAATMFGARKRREPAD